MPVKFNVAIPDGSKVIVLKSMGSNLEGDKLKELIETLKAKKCEITLLAADTLQRYNSNYESAVKLGDEFLQRNGELLKDVKVLRWDEYIASKKELFEANKKLVEDSSAKGSPLYNKMVRTQKKCSISSDLEKSLQYQKEEYAVFLTMSEFDYHLYSMPISDAMAELYKQFPNIKKPEYVHISFPSLQAEKTKSLGIFKPKNKRHENSLPIALRLAYEHVETLLNTSEISEDAKRLFKEQLNNLLILSDAKENQKSTNSLVIVN